MANDSFFLVIEGLDGSGKTSIGRHLAQFCETNLNKKVRLSYEPHDPSAGGLFIRQILEKKITQFTPETLMVAFAANRLDHRNRSLDDWLGRGPEYMIVCDRNYLSSLVYQTNADFSKKHVMDLNQNARQPDLTIFMNVSNEVCYQRMKHRNKPQELFETDLSNTREKYLSAIEFLKKERNEKIVTVDANGTMNEVLRDVIKLLKNNAPAYFEVDQTVIDTYEIPEMDSFSVDQNQTITLQTLVNESKSNPDGVTNRFQQLTNTNKGILFFDYFKNLGYQFKERLSTTHHPAFKMEYVLPGGILQRGLLIVMDEFAQSNLILEVVSNHGEMTDFLLVFALGKSSSTSLYFERDIIQFHNKVKSLFPSVELFTEERFLGLLDQYVGKELEEG